MDGPVGTSMPERSHYDVLGVSAGAGADIVRRAFLRQARRWHPDRPTGDPQRMREVNQAWQVLGDPRSRAAYDRTLVRQTPRPAAVPHPAAACAGASRSAGGPSPPAGGSPAPQGSNPPLEMVGIGWRWISLVVVGLVAVAVVIVFMAASTNDDSGSDAPITVSVPVAESRPEPGDCFLFGADALIRVGCDHPYQGELVSWVTLGAPCPSGTEFRYVRSALEVACYLPRYG